jgi:1-deoxy-D-xylulose-5-phosphate reductoisomerase
MANQANSKGICILGATGTIGANTLDVLSNHSDRFHIVALTANNDVDGLHKLCARYRPLLAAMADPDKAAQLRQRLRDDDLPTEVLAGQDALCQLAEHPDVHTVVAGIVGAAGLPPTLAAARAGKRILLANKEALVMSGQLFMDEVGKHAAELLPIDSEHNAIFQSLPADFSGGLEAAGVNQLLLTASGGPFLNTPLEKLEAVTPEDACAHPNWVMGRKISVDSATMMNKGLEVIEACWLFSVTPDDITVVIHPQSIIHSMVSYVDGSILAQMGQPDMRTPIAHALGWPGRIAANVKPLDFFSLGQLEFRQPDMEKFRCLALAFEAFQRGDSATAILNAANEIAVDSFLERRLRFTDIPRVIEQTLDETPLEKPDSIEHILEIDAQARAHAVDVARHLERA